MPEKPMGMKTIVAGSRHYTDYDAVKAVLDALPWKPTAVLCGCSPGVDALGERWATEHGIPVFHYPAHWARYGPNAGPIRNRRMAVNADAIAAFPMGRSPGTRDMIRAAMQKGLTVLVHEVQETHT